MLSRETGGQTSDGRDLRSGAVHVSVKGQVTAEAVQARVLVPLQLALGGWQQPQTPEWMSTASCSDAQTDGADLAPGPWAVAADL